MGRAGSGLLARPLRNGEDAVALRAALVGNPVPVPGRATGKPVPVG